MNGCKTDYKFPTLIPANEPLEGKRFVEVTEFKTKKDWTMFIKGITDEQYHIAKGITLVMDNYKTHAASVFYEIFRSEESKSL